MNLERIRERKGSYTGYDHNHAGKHSEIMRKQASQARMDEYYLSERDPEGIDMASFDPNANGMIIFDSTS